jgi:hypothetical protein
VKTGIVRLNSLECIHLTSRLNWVWSKSVFLSDHSF